MGSDIRLKFSVGEAGRFISHLDVVRVMERAIRRAKLPIAFSQGFHPTPRMAFASALPVGITSEAEYVDLQMRTKISSQDVQQALNQVLPPGFRVLAAMELPDQYDSLMSIITTAVYQIQVRVPAADLQERVNEVLAADQLLVAHSYKEGDQQKNIRSLIDSLSYSQDANCLHLQCASGTHSNLRPMDLLPFLQLSLGDVSIHRTALLIKLTPEQLVTPFAIVKEVYN